MINPVLKVASFVPRAAVKIAKKSDSAVMQQFNKAFSGKLNGIQAAKDAGVIGSELKLPKSSLALTKVRLVAFKDLAKAAFKKIGNILSGLMKRGEKAGADAVS